MQSSSLSGMPAEPWQNRLERLRQTRVFPERARAIGGDLAALAEQFAQAAQRVGTSGSLWAAHCPPDLVVRTSVQGLARGVLTIAVDNASTRYAVDRWLRAGGEAALIAASRVPLRKVKLTVGG